MSTQVTSDKIVLNFGWVGQNSWNGGWSKGGLDAKVVDLIFKDAKTQVSVSIPDNISPSTVTKFPFTCRKYSENEIELNGRKFKPLIKESHPDSIKLTVEQIRNLTLKIGIFEESPHKGLVVTHIYQTKILTLSFEN